MFWPSSRHYRHDVVADGKQTMIRLSRQPYIAGVCNALLGPITNRINSRQHRGSRLDLNHCYEIAFSCDDIDLTGLGAKAACNDAVSFQSQSPAGEHFTPASPGQRSGFASISPVFSAHGNPAFPLSSTPVHVDKAAAWKGLAGRPIWPQHRQPTFPASAGKVVGQYRPHPVEVRRRPL